VCSSDLPGRVLGQLLENASLSKTAVIKAFLTSGGLRADVIGSGIVKVGMPIKQS